MLKRVEDKYKRIVAAVNPSVKKYVNAGRELWLALYSSIALSCIVVAFYSMNILDFSDPPLTAIAAAMILMPWLKMLNTIANTSSLRRRMEQEFAFLVIASAAVSKTGLELAEMLKYVANSRVFKGVKALGERFVQLSGLFRL